MIDPLSRYIHRNAGEHGPVMLMYHSVVSDARRPDWPWAVSLTRFRSQLDFLAAEGWTTLTMAELIAAPQNWKRRAAIITFDDGYVDNVAAAEELHRRGQRATWFVVTGSIGEYPAWPDKGRPNNRLLNATELRNMRAAGMEVGSHGVTHIRLTEADDNRLKMELTDSKANLENELGTKIISFAYPYGAWDERCANAVRQAGYRGACTTQTGWALRDNNLFSLRRITIYNTDTTSSFARKLGFADNNVSWQSIRTYIRSRLTDKLQGKL